MNQNGVIDPRVEQVSQAVIRYLRLRPTASDTLRGVRDWWLRELDPPPTDRQVLAALHRLERAAAVRRTVNPDGTIVWSMGGALPVGS